MSGTVPAGNFPSGDFGPRDDRIPECPFLEGPESLEDSHG